MSEAPETIAFTVNGRPVRVGSRPLARLADVLREELGLIGTKVGCNAGDCGACTVLLDGEQVCACLVALGQVAGRSVLTVEGLARNGAFSSLQRAFHRHGAAQCGICSPGMLMAATELLRRRPRPSEKEVLDALGGVLCRCTGYRKIVHAVLDAGLGVAAGAPLEAENLGPAVGARVAKIDGLDLLSGAERFGADQAPEDALYLRAVRSPHPRASFRVGDLGPLRARYPGLVRVLNAADVPGRNSFGIYPHLKDQPVLAAGEVRYRGEAVLALVGDLETLRAIADDEIPILWHEQTPVLGLDAALSGALAPVQPDKPDNVLARGRLAKGDLDEGFAVGEVSAEGSWETSFVEHAYIEPEAGYARRLGERIELWVSTQTPYGDRGEVAAVLGIAPERVRIIPSACGGGFGGKLDQSVQPLIALAAWLLERPVRCVYERPESMASSTKRHPARMTARAACTGDGRMTAFEFHGDFNTGAYASWGPTVADRVPIHAAGPYAVPNVHATTRALHTNEPPSGAFRGFGVPQAAIVHEALMDTLAERCGIDALQFRLLNALKVGDETASGQVLAASAGLPACLEALEGRWQEARAEARAFNAASTISRRGVGIGCMWYGCGNTSISNPSTIHVGLSRAAGLTLYSGAVDIGQGANTVIAQICADALGVPVEGFSLVMGDTDRTADAGKTSASRQTFVSGRAAQLAGEDLRRQILRLANVGAAARIELGAGRLVVRDGDAVRELDLEALEGEANGDVLRGEGSFDPPTTALDANGQGHPYATYGFGAQIAEVEVDLELGTVRVRRVTAAHDVGRAVNPTLLEGQVEGGVAQGIGFALMEEYVPGRSENLHDYLIPTAGDVPEVETIIIEEAEPLGPYGAKGVGEPALIPTAPAILNAIHHATGVRITRIPATPGRVRAAILALAAREQDDERG